MKQYIFGHRGASAYAPENTLEAFELAAKMGADGVELDAHLTKDGEIVVTHDERVERVSNGIGYVRDMTLSELKKLVFNKTHPEYTNARIPLLSEVFDLLGPTGMSINVELKNSYLEYPGLEQKVIDLAREKGILDRIVFSSFNHYSMLRVKEIDPSLYCGLLYEATPVRSWEYAKSLGMEALHPHFSETLLPGLVCGKAHELGLEINTWTVNEEEDLRAVIAAGADRVISNYPDRAIRILKEIEG